MSALCELLYRKGLKVGGSDCKKSGQTKYLASLGIDIFYKPNLKAIERAEVIVVSSAISQEDQQLLYAQKLGKKILSRGQLLGQVSQEYKNVIAVSGAHGKTTTTALIAHIFISAGLNPTVHIGGVIQGQKSSLINGVNDYFITEACEYKDNFLSLNPSFAVILNIEPEHLDYFKTFENVKKSFIKFSEQSEHFIAQNALFEQKLFHKEGQRLGKDWSYKNYQENSGGLSFECLHNGQLYMKVKCPLHGEHNAGNILSAISAATYYGIDKKKIAAALSTFKGVGRRFEKHKFYNGSSLIFDYAHHPTEIKCSIASVKKFCKGKLIVIFQPHTYSRTVKFFDDFLSCFKGADELIIFKTYPAREKYVKAGSGKTLYKALSQKQVCSYSADYNLLSKLEDKVGESDCVLVIGAGDFYDKCKLPKLQ